MHHNPFASLARGRGRPRDREERLLRAAGALGERHAHHRRLHRLDPAIQRDVHAGVARVAVWILPDQGEQILALLDAGVDPNARYRADLTALMWAAGYPDITSAEAALRTLKLLLSRGAKVDLVDDRGRDALMIAAGNGFNVAVEVLLEAGANRAFKLPDGKTAADLARERDHLELAKSLE